MAINTTIAKIDGAFDAALLRFHFGPRRKRHAYIRAAIKQQARFQSMVFSFHYFRRKAVSFHIRSQNFAYAASAYGHRLPRTEQHRHVICFSQADDGIGSANRRHGICARRLI